jgi:hypothetical protein
MKGKFRFIEISRRSYENNSISNVCIDFSQLNVVSCILHYDLRKIIFLFFKTLFLFYFQATCFSFYLQPDAYIYILALRVKYFRVFS